MAPITNHFHHQRPAAISPTNCKRRSSFLSVNSAQNRHPGVGGGLRQVGLSNSTRHRYRTDPRFRGMTFRRGIRPIFQIFSFPQDVRPLSTTDGIESDLTVLNVGGLSDGFTAGNFDHLLGGLFTIASVGGARWRRTSPIDFFACSSARIPTVSRWKTNSAAAVSRFDEHDQRCISCSECLWIGTSTGDNLEKLVSSTIYTPGSSASFLKFISFFSKFLQRSSPASLFTFR